MELQKFIGILHGLDEAITELNVTAGKKQDAIIHNKHDEIEKILSVEQKLLQKIDILEKERIEEMNVIKSKHSIPAKIKNLEDLIPLLSENYSQETTGQLTNLRNNIKEQSEKLRITNNQNKVLIDNSRFFIKALITNLRGTANNFVINTKV